MKSVVAFLGFLSATPAHAVDLAAVTNLLADPRGLAAPGCVAGAFRDGEPMFITAAGAADIQQRRPLDGDSVFYAASVSKQFTALAAAKLIEDGKLSLEDDISTYLPEMTRYDAPITIGMLMHHTSGVRDWVGLYRIMGGRSLGDPSADALLQLLFRQRGTNFTPGVQYDYSNGGYLLLAEIVGRVAGMPFSDYAAQVILKPLGMTSSSFLDGMPLQAPNIANGYVPDDDGFEIRNNYPLFSGSGGLMTSINDLAKYERDIAKGSVVWTPVVREIMLTPGRLSSGAPALTGAGRMAYGGGLLIGQNRGQYFVEHSGSSETFKMFYARLPERKLAVIVNCNRGDWTSGSRAMKIIELIEGDILDNGRNSATGAAPERPSDSPSDEAASPQKAQSPALPFGRPLETLAGRYVSDELPASFLLTVEDAVLVVTVTSPYTEPYKRRIGQARCDADGSCGPPSFRLKFDSDGRGFTVSTGGARGVRFQRALPHGSKPSPKLN